MSRKVDEIIEVHDFERYRASTGPSFAKPVSKRIVVESRVVDAQNGPGLIRGIRETIEAEPNVAWVVELSEVKYMDTAAVSVLAQLLRDAEIGPRVSLTGVGQGLKARWPMVFGTGSDAASGGSGA